MKMLTRTLVFAALCSMTVACIESAPSSGNNANNANNANNVNNSNNVNNANNLNNVNNSNNFNNANNTNAQTNNSDWHLPNWNKRIGFDITPTGFDGTLEDFTAAFRPNLASVDGFDVETARFVTAEGATIPHELAKDEVDETLFWLRLPAIAEDQSQRIWLYWDTDETVTNDSAGAWGSQFGAVYHFDAADLGLNSVKGEADLTCSGCLRDIGTFGWALDANQEGLVGDLPDKLLPGPGDIVTVSAWYRPDSANVDIRGPLVIAESYCVGWQLALVKSTDSIYASAAADDNVDPGNDATYCQVEDRSAAISPIVDTPDPRHVVAVFDRESDEVLLYIDAELDERESLALGQLQNDTSAFQPRLRIGTYGDPTLDFLGNGTIDEVFIMVGELDDEWIAAHFANVRTWSELTAATEVQQR